MLIGALAAVIVIALIVTIVLVTNRSTGTNQRAGTPTKPTTQPAASNPATTAQTTTGAPTAATTTAAPAAPNAQGKTLPPLPAGWVDYHDPTGFSVYVPANWRRSKESSIMYFRGDGRVLGVDQTNKPHMDPVADWRSQSNYRVSRGDFPNYHEIKIAHVDYFITAADWEFTFDRNGRQHVNNRGVVVSNHQAYGFYWQTADSQWDAARPDLQLVFDSFRPAK
jgi:hypothetical protein